MFVTRKHISRRAVLKGAGVAISLPLLDAMIPAATALAATAAVAKPRIAFVYFPHGAVMDRWQPKETGTQFEFPQILEPLEPYKSYTTVVTGLRNKEAESSDPHGIIAGTWLSCVGPKDRDGTGDRGITADQLAARAIGQETPLPSIELAGESAGGVACAPGVGCGFASTVSFRTPNQPLPMENNPRKVFYQLFGEGDTDTERAEIVQETGSILDHVMDKARRMSGELGPSDRAALADYLDSVREIERRIQKMQAAGAAQTHLPDAPSGVPEDFGEQLKVMFELMTLAWQTDKTRVITFMMAKEVSMRTYNQIGVSDAFHPLSHHQNDPSKLDRLAKIQTYHTKMFATGLLQRLQQVKDGEGSLLDHSIILFGSNMSNSDKHNNDPLPSAVLGHGGRIKGGQHLHYPQDTPHANLLFTLLDRANVHLPALGNSTGLLQEI